MFDAAEWLASVAEAARAIQRDAVMAEARRLAAQRLSAPTGIGGGSADPMGPLDEAIDQDATRRQRLAHAYDELREAARVFEGLRSVGLMEQEAADVMELVSIGCMTIDEAAEALRTSPRTAKRRKRYGLEWLDAHGLAYAKAGTGRAYV